MQGSVYGWVKLRWKHNFWDTQRYGVKLKTLIAQNIQFWPVLRP